MPAERVAAFDFDGTLTRRDTLMGFLWAASDARGRARGLLASPPALLAYEARAVDNHRAKTWLVRAWLRGAEVEAVRAASDRYAETISRLERPEALRRLAWHRALGDRVVVVTASFEVSVRAWVRRRGLRDVRVIGSRLAAEGGRLTGALDGRSCAGAEKVRRLEPHLLGAELWAYGDSRGDTELLARADRAFYRRFDGP